MTFSGFVFWVFFFGLFIAGVRYFTDLRRSSKHTSKSDTSLTPNASNEVAGDNSASPVPADGSDTNSQPRIILRLVLTAVLFFLFLDLFVSAFEAMDSGLENSPRSSSSRSGPLEGLGVAFIAMFWLIGFDLLTLIALIVLCIVFSFFVAGWLIQMTSALRQRVSLLRKERTVRRITLLSIIASVTAMCCVALILDGPSSEILVGSLFYATVVLSCTFVWMVASSMKENEQC